MSTDSSETGSAKTDTGRRFGFCGFQRSSEKLIIFLLACNYRRVIDLTGDEKHAVDETQCPREDVILYSYTLAHKCVARLQRAPMVAFFWTPINAP